MKARSRLSLGDPCYEKDGLYKVGELVQDTGAEITVSVRWRGFVNR